VPFTLVYAGNIGRQIKNTDDTETKHNQKKQTMLRKNSKTKLPWFSRLYDTRPVNEVNLFYSALDD